MRGLLCRRGRPDTLQSGIDLFPDQLAQSRIGLNISTFREFSKRGSVGVKALDRRLVEHWTLNRRKDWNHWNGWTGRSGFLFENIEP